MEEKEGGITMASRRTHDVVATVGTYKDRSTGEEKKRYSNVGSAFTDDQGRITIKLDTVPCAPEWSGWLSLYPVKDEQRAPRQSSHASQRPARRDPEDDDIPF